MNFDCVSDHQGRVRFKNILVQCKDLLLATDNMDDVINFVNNDNRIEELVEYINYNELSYTDAIQSSMIDIMYNNTICWDTKTCITKHNTVARVFNLMYHTCYNEADYRILPVVKSSPSMFNKLYHCLVDNFIYAHGEYEITLVWAIKMLFLLLDDNKLDKSTPLEELLYTVTISELLIAKQCTMHDDGLEVEEDLVEYYGGDTFEHTIRSMISTILDGNDLIGYQTKMLKDLRLEA